MNKQIEEPQKSVVPKFVADWIEKSTDPFTKAEKIAYLIKSKDGDSYYFCDWFVRDGILTQEQGEELFAWATRQSYETLLSLYNGYEVEKEPLYYVRLPYEVWDEEAAELKQRICIYIMRSQVMKLEYFLQKKLGKVLSPN